MNQGNKVMNKLTAQNFIDTPAWVSTVVPEALSLVAKTNGQTVELTREAYCMGVPNVVNSVNDLVMEAAKECAKRMNK